MNFEKKREGEEECCLIGLALIFLRRPVSWLSLLAPALLHILGLRFLHLLLTSGALFFSYFFFPLSLPPHIVQSSKQDQEQEQDLDYLATKDINGKSEDNLAKSDGNLETTKEEDVNGAIPDDESLIELSLPSGQYLGHHYTSNKNNLYVNSKVQDFRLFDLFTEFNDFTEEDNLIEIDITIGSIKYSRFEIKA
ncbi:unnamed protein product [Microthlaspi erraticum]|uniref:Uncharacterized protein n=1 Tax=Microthlaspi erraticum TaxID=1685480 RepID=A0A6D2I5R8_9BRAS|nr:unnamed protein product [Microthlaspi erraticum]CAA7023666.1 unnamed protein product [Microthlaspi erraticum]